MKRILLVLVLLNCASYKPTVIPADRVIEPAPGKPGYFIISAGMLKDLHDQNLRLVSELEKCKSVKK